jgi:hypothetical protein
MLLLVLLDLHPPLEESRQMVVALALDMLAELLVADRLERTETLVLVVVVAEVRLALRLICGWEEALEVKDKALPSVGLSRDMAVVVAVVALHMVKTPIIPALASMAVVVEQTLAVTLVPLLQTLAVVVAVVVVITEEVLLLEQAVS